MCCLSAGRAHHAPWHMAGNYGRMKEHLGILVQASHRCRFRAHKAVGCGSMGLPGVDMLGRVTVWWRPSEGLIWDGVGENKQFLVGSAKALARNVHGAQAPAPTSTVCLSRKKQSGA